MFSSPNYLAILAAVIALAVILILLFRKVTLKSQCPVCGDRHPDRITRAKWLKAIQPVLPVKAYRCLSCRHRFYQLGADHNHAHQ
jgi:hypothetical protein